MADETPNSKTTTQSTSGNKEEGNIIDRKIERRGLPFSFSSNLSPPRQRDEKGTASCGKSVKSIVNFFETSKSNTASAVSVAGEPMKGKPPTTSAKRLTSSTTASAAASEKPPVSHQNSLANPPDVEEYSLTLLKYRQYFTDQPLARCLDKQEQKVLVSSEPSIHDDQKLNNPKTRKVDPQHPGTNKTSKANTSSTPSTQEDSAQELIYRNPEEVAAYWSNVRNYLWLSDEQLEGTEKTQIESMTAPRATIIDTAVPAGDDPLLLSPSLPPPRFLRGSHRTDSSVSERSLNEQKRFLASTERQISEIDAFVSRRQREELGSPYASTNHMSALPSPFASPLGSPMSATSFTDRNTQSIDVRERCTSCSKIRASQGNSSHRKSGASTDRPPPPRAPMNLSRGMPGRVVEPPVRGENDQMWNFF